MPPSPPRRGPTHRRAPSTGTGRPGRAPAAGVALLTAGVAVGVALRADPATAPTSRGDAATAAWWPPLDPPPAPAVPPRTAREALGGGALERGAVEVEGAVRDALDRRPVADAEVVFADGRGSHRVRAGGDGRYRLTLPPGRYRAVARGDQLVGVVPALRPAIPRPPGDDDLLADPARAPLVVVDGPRRGVDLEVRRAGYVDGRLVDEQGRPVAGALVRADPGAWRTVLATEAAATDADGRFRLALPGGRHLVAVAHPDFAGAMLPGGDAPVQVAVQPGMETTLTVVAVRGCIVGGRVLAPDGSPAGAGALEVLQGDEFRAAAELAADGSFRLPVPWAPRVVLRAWPWKSMHTAEQVVACDDDPRPEVTLRVLDDLADLAGTLTDASGQVVPDALLHVRGLTAGTLDQQERVDDAGGWAVFALPPGDYAVTAHEVGRGVAAQRLRVPGDAGALRLGGTGALTGAVSGLADGETFRLTFQGCAVDGTAVPLAGESRLVVVEAGRYRVAGVPACALDGEARAPGVARRVRARVPAGGVGRLDLALAPLPEKRVEVRVVDRTGAPLPGARVRVLHLDVDAPPGAPAATSADGSLVVAAHAGDQVEAFVVVGGQVLAAAAAVGDGPGVDEAVELRLDLAID